MKVSTAVCGVRLQNQGTGFGGSSATGSQGDPHFKDEETKFRDRSDFTRDTGLTGRDSTGSRPDQCQDLASALLWASVSSPGVLLGGGETPLQNRGQCLLCWDPIGICQDAPSCLLVASFLGGWLSSTTESVREKCPL